MTKPFDTYYGGKEAPGVYQTIINHIRPHHLFAEAFGGNYTISRKINNIAQKFINDIDKEVYRKYVHINDRIKFYNMDYRDFVTDFLHVHDGFPFKRVIYFDPPYPLLSRKSGRKVYKYEMTYQQHVEFLDYARSLTNRADILISTYPNDLYKDTLTDWYRVEFEGCDRQGKTTEWLFLNYDPKQITALHDSQYYGGALLSASGSPDTSKIQCEKSGITLTQ